MFVYFFDCLFFICSTFFVLHAKFFGLIFVVVVRVGVGVGVFVRGDGEKATEHDDKLSYVFLTY